MATQLVLRFDNADELMLVLQFLKNNGLERLAFQPKRPSRHKKREKKAWASPVGNLGGKLDHINIRDYANEN